MQNNAIVLLSGGLDSALALLLARGEANVRCTLTFDYQQRSASKEIAAAQGISRHLGIPHQTVALPFFQTITGHPFFNHNIECPTPRLDQLDDPSLGKETARAVWVPNRNGVFINMAAALAESQGVHAIYTGFNIEEAATFPDNSQGFIEAINHALSFSTLNHVQVRCPTLKMRKAEILKYLVEKEFPLKLLWSCYNDHHKMCGVCESCQRLKRAMTANNLQDTIGGLFVS